MKTKEKRKNEAYEEYEKKCEEIDAEEETKCKYCGK